MGQEISYIILLMAGVVVEHIVFMLQVRHCTFRSPMTVEGEVEVEVVA